MAQLVQFCPVALAKSGRMGVVMNKKHSQQSMSKHFFLILGILLSLPPALGLDSPNSLMLDRGVMSFVGTAYSPDGKWVAASGSDNDVTLYETASGHAVRRFFGARWPNFSSDSKELCALSSGGELRVWDIASEKLLLDTQIKVKNNAAVWRAEFCPDKHLIAVTDNESVRIIDVASGHQVGEIKEELLNSHFSSDGKKIVGLVKNNNLVLTLALSALIPPSFGDFKVWDVSTGREESKMPLSPSEFPSFAVSPVNDSLAISKGYCTKIVDVETGKDVCVINGESVVLSPDGSGAVNAATVAPMVPLKGTLVHALSNPQHSHELKGRLFSDPSFSGDNKRIATKDDSKLYIWDFATGEKVGELPGTPGQLCSSLSNDGKLCALVLVAKNGDLMQSALFDVASAKKLRDLPLGQKVITAEDDLISKFSPNGNSIVTLIVDAAASKTDVRVWNVADGSTRKSFSVPRKISRMTLSPDGKFMACGFLDATAAIYDLNSGKEIHKFQISHVIEPTAKTAPVCFSADGKVLYVGGSDFLKTFDLTTGKEIKRTNLDFCPDSIAITPKGKVLAAGWAHALSVCNLHGKELSTAYSPLYTISAAGFSQDGKYLYGLGGRDHVTLRIWDAATGQHLSTNVLFDNKSSEDAWLISQSKLSGDLKTAMVPISGSAAIVDAKDGHERLRLPQHVSEITWIAYPPKGGSLVFSTKGGDLRLLDTKTGKLSRHGLPGQEKLLVAVTADGAKIATKERKDTQTELLDVKSGQISSLPGAQKYSECMDFSADGKTLYEGSTEKPYFTALSTDAGKNLPLPAELCNSEIYAIALSSDGKMLLIGNKSEIRAWNLTTNAIQWVCKKNDPDLWNLTCKLKISPDNKIVAASSTDMKIRLWNVATGQLLQTLSTGAEVNQDIAISPDSKKIAVCKDDRTVVVWSMETGKQLSNALLQGGYVESLAFSPDGKMLIGGSTKGSLIFWSAENLKELCSVVPIDKSDWVVLDAQRAHFDASPGGAHLLHIYRDGAFLSGEEVKKIGYRPNLFLQVTGGKLSAK